MIRSITVLFGLFILPFLFLPGCTTRLAPDRERAPQPAIERPGEVKAAPSTPGEAWMNKWESVISNAKKEGKLVIYASAGGILRDMVGGAFKEKYGIELEFLSARGSEIAVKLTAERRAGLYIPDIYLSGAQSAIIYLKPRGYLEPLELALLLPEVLDPRLWLEGEFPWVDKDRTVVGFVATANTPLAINTSLVKPDEITSYKDLLKPEWKGKLLMNDVTMTGPGGNWFGAAQLITGLEFMRDLARQEPVMITNYRLQVEWLTQGKYTILIAPDYDTVMSFIRVGAPLKGITPIEGTFKSTAGGNIALFNRAPHPDAAKLFINWLLSREGQKVYVPAVGNPSARIDVPPEGVDPGRVLNPRIKYINAQSEEKLLRLEEDLKIANEIFGHLKR